MTTSSRLEAAKRTGEIAMRSIGYRHAPGVLAALNERDLGAPTGLTRDEASARFGEEATARRAHGSGSDDPLVAEMIRAFEVEPAPRLRRPWRTGMALLYRFDAGGAIVAGDEVPVQE